MKSIKNIYKVGFGPSSSHTMAPVNAAKLIKDKYPNCNYVVTLYGSLALTGKGHLTDYVIKRELNNVIVEFNLEKKDLIHPNTIEFKVYKDELLIDDIFFYSVGGGELKSDFIKEEVNNDIYDFNNLNEIIEYCKTNNKTLVDFIDEHEDLNDYLNDIFDVMLSSIKRGISTDGILPGGLNVDRRAKSIYQKYLNDTSNHSAFIYSQALAVSEENASASGLIVTAPTCGSCGILPACLSYAYHVLNIPKKQIINALKVAGLIGEVVRCNASISGALVGCQGEVGVACSMAAAAYCYLIGGNIFQIEYASEIALEHHLGLTCDPVMGLVQIPCIERNALASTKAIDAAKYAILTDGMHKISFDDVVKAMMQTGIDMKKGYKETSLKGLANIK